MAPRFDYFFRETAHGLKRNALVVFAGITTAFVALFLLGMALLVRSQVNLFIELTEADVQVAVYLRDDISPSQQQHLFQLLNTMPEVATVRYESKDEAWDRAQEIFKNEQEVLQSVSRDAFPASFRVNLDDPKQFGVVSARLASEPGIDNIVDHRDLLTRLFKVTDIFKWGMSAIALIMMVSSAAIIGNTVRMAVFARRKEIGIMRLVGATNWFIRVPFIIEGVFEGLLGAGAAILGLFVLKAAFIEPLRGKIQFLPWVGTSDVIATVPWLLGAGVLVAVVASLFAMRRFLEV